jgi:hypothetical protein
MQKVRDMWAKSREHLTAIATIVVVPFVIGGAIVGYLAFHDENSRDSKQEASQAAATVRAQAERVSATTIAGEGGFPISNLGHGRSATRIALYNRSNAPIYDVVVTLVLVQGAGPRFGAEVKERFLRHEFQRYFGSVPPGQYEAQVSQMWAGMMARPGIEIAFRDSNGRTWVRYANGQLVALNEPTATYYKLEEPVNWVSPKPLP